MTAARTHAESSGQFHLIRQTFSDGSHRAFCGVLVDGPYGSAAHPHANRLREPDEVAESDRCLTCVRNGKWAPQPALF